jgi:hypothetical protein
MLKHLADFPKARSHVSLLFTGIEQLVKQNTSAIKNVKKLYNLRRSFDDDHKRC